jgi:hypothetical protein
MSLSLNGDKCSGASFPELAKTASRGVTRAISFPCSIYHEKLAELCHGWRTWPGAKNLVGDRRRFETEQLAAS